MNARRMVAVILGAVGFVGGACGQAANPILAHADPFITFDPATRDGQYVLTATGRDITLWSGPTPASAAMHSHVIYTPKDGMTQMWSPTVWKMGGRWWVYFTAQMAGETHKVYVLRSDTEDVLGAYRFEGALETGRPSIDPSVLVVGTARYLMYVTVDGGANRIWVRKLKGPMEFEGEAALMAEPEAPWEKGAGSGKDYPVDEGPTALYHAGRTFVVFSASDTASPRYCLGLLELQGRDPMVRENWKKTAQPVFTWSPENGIYGPGRGTFARAKDGSYWLLYAAKSSDAETAAGREIRAQRFTWGADGTPEFGAPVKDGPISK